MAQHVVWQLRPTQTELHAHLDLYFQSCSILINAQIGARLAGTLANGGICPSSSSRVFDADTTRDCLSLMYSCGMYNFSGQAPEPHTQHAHAHEHTWAWQADCGPPHDVVLETSRRLRV